MPSENRWTVKAFAEAHNFSEEYVRQMCRQQTVKGKVERLPEGWRAEKVGRDWFIVQMGMERAEAEREWSMPTEDEATDFSAEEIAQYKSSVKRLAETSTPEHQEPSFQKMCNALSDFWNTRTRTEDYVLTKRAYPQQYLITHAWRELQSWLCNRPVKDTPPTSDVRELEKLPELIAALGLCHRFACRQTKEVSVNIIFSSDGKYKIDLNLPEDEPLLYDQILGGQFQNHVSQWLHDLLQGQKQQVKRRQRESFSHCLNCGRPLSRKNSLFCSDGDTDCGDTYKKWIKSHVPLTDTSKFRVSIVRKLRKMYDDSAK